jgi:hypothetical protein
MPYPPVFLIHSATLNSRRQNFTLGYDAGTAVFHAGAMLTGATSHATAVIVSIGSIASGSLQVHSITGTFLNDEPISDNGTVPGAATVNGVISEARDINEELVYTDIALTVSCRFVGPQESMRVGSRNVPYIVSSPRVILPAGTSVAEGDTITSFTLGFIGTFQINSVKQVYEAAQSIVSHISCEIATAGATGGDGV